MPDGALLPLRDVDAAHPAAVPDRRAVGGARVLRAVGSVVPQRAMGCASGVSGACTTESGAQHHWHQRVDLLYDDVLRLF